jgi:ribosomal subunit interface protein
MDVTVTCRHDAVGEAARRYAEAKAARLERYFDRLRGVDVVFDGGKDHRFTAELIVAPLKGEPIVCRAGSSTATAAFDEAYGKMERMLTRLKERVREHGGKQTRRATRRLERRRLGAETSGTEATEEPGAPLW